MMNPYTHTDEHPTTQPHDTEKSQRRITNTAEALEAIDRLKELREASDRILDDLREQRARVDRALKRMIEGKR